jgi:alpha-tubulin suppressor-like RCC1 family protein
VPIDPGAIVDLAIGHYRACAVRADGRVACWGSWPWDPAHTPPPQPTAIAGIDEAVQVAGDDQYWCARRKNGEVRCWSAESPTPKTVIVSGAAELDGAACARTVDGKVVCWDADHAPKPVPRLEGGVKAISHNGNAGVHCAVRADRTVACWGANNWHQLGDGTTADSDAAVPVKGVTGVDEVSLSYFFGTCARRSHSITCWGGELNGDGATRDIAGLTDVVQIGVAEYHACARRANGRIVCWGANASAQLGSAHAPEDALHEVNGIVDAVDVQVGSGEPCGGCGSTCARTKAGTLLCWGALNGADKPTPVDLTLH